LGSKLGSTGRPWGACWLVWSVLGWLVSAGTCLSRMFWFPLETNGGWESARSVAELSVMFSIFSANFLNSLQKRGKMTWMSEQEVRIGSSFYRQFLSAKPPYPWLWLFKFTLPSYILYIYACCSSVYSIYAYLPKLLMGGMSYSFGAVSSLYWKMIFKQIFYIKFYINKFFFSSN